MSNWKLKATKPPEGITVAIMSIHWKGKGWLSTNIDFGEVVYAEHVSKDCWYVNNCDDRGTGSESWYLEDFDYWSYPDDVIKGVRDEG